MLIRFSFILITILINFSNPLLIKSEEKIESPNSKTGNTFKTESLKNKKSITNNIHIVKVGDTISSISKSYSIHKNLIIKLNDLKDENYIYVGQNLIISNLNNNFIGLENLKNKGYHIVKTGENLTEISNKYQLNLENLIEINSLNNPDSIKVGKKLFLSKNKIVKANTFKKNETKDFINLNKKIYGPLIIQSNTFEKKNGRKTLNVLNQNNKKLILSISCKSKELDVRIPWRKWRGWEPAKEEFEKNLINDIC